MRIDQLKARVQPVLEQDFDALYEEFVEETGERGAEAFLAHLVSFGLVTDELRQQLLSPPPPDEIDEEEAHTIVAGEDLMAQVEALTAGMDGPDALEPDAPTGDEPIPRDHTFEMPIARALGDDAPARAPRRPPQVTMMVSGDELQGTPDAPRRTMFRRMTDGVLKETGVQEIEERRKRQDRPRRRSRSTPPPQEDGRYTFIGTVGEGAMGRVHLAEDSTLHRKVAYKAMSDEIAEQSTLASKFSAEAQITAQLDHPNIVPVYSLESATAYTMKLIKGRTLEQIIAESKAQGPRPKDDQLTLQSRLELFLRACDAMFYAHSRGVVHRDLKPENIMVGEFGELYVMDWGISRLMNGHFEDKVALGAEPDDEGDLIIGTPGYMSPEQADGRNDELDGRSDQYALGLILFELVALKPAVTGKAPLKLVMRHQDGEKDPLVHARGEPIPPELVAIIHKATAKDPARRYESVKAMADDLRRFLRGEAVRAKPDSPMQSLLRWVGRHRELTLVAMLLIFMGSGTLIMGTFVVSQFAIAAQKAREQQLSNLLTTVARQSSLIDGQFLRYEGLLSVIGTTAVDKLQSPSYDEDRLFLGSDYDDPERRPDGMVDSTRYGIPIHLVHGVFTLPPGVTDDKVLPDMHRLEDMEKHFYRVLLRSRSEAAVGYAPNLAQRAIAETGVPLAWTYIGLDNGVYTAFPGHGGFPARFDHRESHWYELARKTRSPTWGAPSVDVSGMMLVLTCAQALYADDESFLGVAGIDVTFDYIIEELLEAPEFKGAKNIEAFLLDPNGKVAVRSTKKGKEFKGAIRSRTLRMPDFHHAQVVKDVQEGRSGHLQARGPNGTELVVYNRMNSIGWYYVVVGDVNELLALGGA